jgi:hypothetical protein
MAKSIQTVEDMRQALETNDRILCGAVLALYKCQTADEQQSQATRHENGMGFNGTDANILSSFAEQIRQRKEQERAGTLPTGYGLLSPKQIELARKKMPKYAKQLLRLAGCSQPAGNEEPAQPAPAADPKPNPCVNPKTGTRYFCVDCGLPADVMQWETSLCNGCFGARERLDIEVNRARNDMAMAKQQAIADQARQEQEQAARLDSSLCDCGKLATESFNGLLVCPDCQATMEQKEAGRRYREGKRLQAGQEEAERPSLLVHEGDTLRFMTPKEQYAAGYRLELRTGRQVEPVRLQEEESDPFGGIPAAYCVI